LYIGIGSNHPGGGLGMGLDEEPQQPLVIGQGDQAHFDEVAHHPPSVVGYAANYGLTHAFDFIGDFIYQPALREEKADVIETIVGRCLERFMAAKDRLPSRVILFRNGVSEGFFQNVLKFDVPLVKAVIAQRSKYVIPLTVIVTNKISQEVRFFKKNVRAMDKGPEQNIIPGTVIDTTVVHPLFIEFFLNSHKTLQGTAKTPKYNVIYDEAMHTLDTLERMCYELCYGYQIVFFPVSLPVPVYIAMQYAKRGRNLYKLQRIRLEQRGVGRSTYAALSRDLSFDASQTLSSRRVNA